MTTLRTAAQQALEALKSVQDHRPNDETNNAITNLRAALAQQAEPVHPSGFAYRYPDGVRFNNGGEVNGCLPSEVIPYYLGKAPHQQQAEPGQAGCETEADCTSQPWCRFKGECLRKQAEPFTTAEIVRMNEAWLHRRAVGLNEQAEPDHETRAELAEQQVVQLAEERDHYRNLWRKARQAEPVAWADKISFENAMKTGKGHDVWPKAGDYETRTGRALIGLYTAPPQRKPLTEEEIYSLFRTAGSPTAFARAIERKVRGEEK